MPRVLHCLAVLCLFCLATTAHAHEPPSGLLMHLPLDGSLNDASGNGFSADYIEAGGILATQAPEFTEGKHGQALYLDGEHGLRIPLDLSPEVHPTVTVTAWVYQEPGGSGAPIFTHGHKSLNLHRNGTNGVWLGAPGGGIMENYAFRPQRWHFIAAAIDTTGSQVLLQIDRRGQSNALDSSAYSTPYRDVWFGTYGDAVNNNLKGYRLDDLRIYDRVLTDEELEGLALGQAMSADNEGTAPSGITGTSSGAINTGSASTTANEMEAARTADYGSDNEQTSDAATSESPSEPTVIGWRLSESDYYVSELAGWEGSVKRLVEVTNGGPLQRLGWIQGFDNPCRVIVAGSDGTGEKQAGTCKSTVRSERLAQLGDSEFITGIDLWLLDSSSTATSDRVDRMRIRGFAISDAGEKRASVSDETQDSNYSLDTPDLEVQSTDCRSGYLSSGVSAEFSRSANDSTSLRGLKLICRKVEKIYQ